MRKYKHINDKSFNLIKMLSENGLNNHKIGLVLGISDVTVGYVVKSPSLSGYKQRVADINKRSYKGKPNGVDVKEVTEEPSNIVDLLTQILVQLKLIRTAIEEGKQTRSFSLFKS